MVQAATFLFWAGIAGLLYLDRDRNSRVTTSLARWIPSIWVILGASRMVSQWLGTSVVMDSPDQYLEGSPLDRNILSGLMGCGLLILLSRRQRAVSFLRQNWVILLFFVYCAASIFWSDFPMTAFKRWTKALGNVTMIAVVLTDEDPKAAIKQFFARAAFFLIPVSVLLIKYYPHLGRGYYRFSWATYYSGVSTDKNGLGLNCMVFGLTSVWRVLDAFQERRSRERTQVILAHCTVLAMAAWLFLKANSATSLAVFMLGSLLLVLTTQKGKKHARTVHTLVGILAAAGVFIWAFPDTYDSLVRMLGRKPDLTGRTDIWNDVFRVKLNPWIGTGFESFWLGNRARYFWAKYIFHPNQAHNGYIEMYVNLGWAGVSLLMVQILAGYRNVSAAYRNDLPAAPLRLALFVAAVMYNVTEAAFKVMHPVWIAFLFAIFAVPKVAKLVPQGPAARTAEQATKSQWFYGERPTESELLVPHLVPAGGIEKARLE